MPNSSHVARSSSKKIIAYALIGILVVAAVSISVFARPAITNPNPTTTPNPANDQDRLQEFREVWCGSDAVSRSTAYVTEVGLPNDCEMPAGIAVDDTNVWYVSVKRGSLGSYSLSDGKFKEYVIPDWPSREQTFTNLPQMSWTVKSDKSGDVWFTDQNNIIWRFNKATESFEMFKVPAKYPSALDFDSKGNIYFIGINSKSLFYGDVSKMRNGTSDGISEIPLPLEGFSGIDPQIMTTGLIAVDNVRNNVWVSMLAFIEHKGQIFRYNINTAKVDRIVSLPADLSSPVGATTDNSGNLWVADHATSLFYKYDPSNGKITKFVTSIASSKIYGGKTPSDAYTLPYWLATGQDGSLWFNEHFGNRISRFDPTTLTLTEYWIPSQNKNWAKCPVGSATCGIANALQFGLNPNNQAWLSEWTENKIAKVDTYKAVPITVLAPDEITVAKGTSAEIKVSMSASGDFSGQMMASSTLTPNGMFGNSTAIFSEESISISAGSTKQVSLTLTPAEDLAPGEYTIMVGAGNDDINVLKAVRVNVA